MKKITFLILALGAWTIGCDENDKENGSLTSCEDGVQRTLSCDDGVKTQQCNDGEWTDLTECGDPTGPDFVCKDGDEKTVMCEEGTGLQQMVCTDNAWTAEGDCITIKCTEGATQAIPCPSDAEKVVEQTCRDGKWVTASTCEYPSQVCDENDEIEVECGLDGNGTQKMKCTKGQWTFDGSCHTAECADGEFKEVSCGASYDKIQRKKCIDGSWQDMGGCVAPISMGNIALERRVVNDEKGTSQIQLLMEFENGARVSTEIQIHNSNDGKWLPVIIVAEDPSTATSRQIITTIENLDLMLLIDAVMNWNDEAALALLPDEISIKYWDYIETDALNRITQYATRNTAGELIYRGTYTYDETHPQSMRTATLSYIDTSELSNYVDPNLDPLLGNPAYFAWRADEILLETGDKVTTNIEFLFSDTTGPVTQYVSSFYGETYLNREKIFRQINTKGSLLMSTTYKLASDNTTVLPLRYYDNLNSFLIDMSWEYQGDALVTLTAKDNRARTVKSVGYTYDGDDNLTEEVCSSSANSYSHCSSFEGAPANNYTTTIVYDGEGQVTHLLQIYDDDDAAETDPLTLEEWVYEDGHPKSAYTHVPRTFCQITTDYPWDSPFIQNNESCSSGPDDEVVYELWSYDEHDRVTSKKGYENKDDAAEGEGDNPLYVQTIAYTGADILEPTEIAFRNNFENADNTEYQNFGTVFTFEYLDDDWVKAAEHEEYNAVIPAADAGYCTNAEGTTPTPADCDSELCSDADENEEIDIETECAKVYEETPTRDLDYETLYKKVFDGDLLASLDIRNEGYIWRAVEFDDQGGMARWMDKEPETGALLLEKTINPKFAHALDLFLEPKSDNWNSPIVLQGKKYDSGGDVVQEYELDAATGWPLRLACTGVCATSSWILEELNYYPLNTMSEWLLYDNAAINMDNQIFSRDFDNMEETYSHNDAEGTTEITLKTSRGDDALATIWQKTTREYMRLVYDPWYGWVMQPIYFVTSNLIETEHQVANAKIFWDESGSTAYTTKAFYNHMEQTYNEATEAATITTWELKYNKDVDGAPVETEITLVSSVLTDGVLTDWTCNYVDCYDGPECTRAENAGAGKTDQNQPCNFANIKITSENSTFTETRTVQDGNDHIWSETTTVYADASAENFSARTSRQRLDSALFEDGNDENLFEVTMREIYEKIADIWLISEYYALENDGIVWQKYYYDENSYPTKKEFLEASGDVLTWHDYINTYMTGSNAILNTVIKNEYGIPIGSIDYFWTNL